MAMESGEYPPYSPLEEVLTNVTFPATPPQDAAR